MGGGSSGHAPVPTVTALHTAQLSKDGDAASTTPQTADVNDGAGKQNVTAGRPRHPQAAHGI